MSESGPQELVGLRDEVARRLVHASGAVVPLAWVFGRDVGVEWIHVRAFLVVFAVAVTILEVLRLYVGLEWVVFEKLTREYEQENPAGYALYTWSATAVALAFEPEIAVPAMLALMLADPVSGLLSDGELRTVKRPRVLAAMFGTSFVLAWSFLPLSAAFLGAVGATVADGVKPRFRGVVVDDNLSIPLAVAAAAWLGLRYVPPVLGPLSL